MLVFGTPDILNPPNGPTKSVGGLGSYVERMVEGTGGLLPGQRITFEQAMYVYRNGQTTELYEGQNKDWPKSQFGSLSEFLDYYQNILMRYTAQVRGDQAYADYIQARNDSAPQVAAMLEFDASGRLTDESAQAANDYQAQLLAPQIEALAQAQQNAAEVAAVIEQNIQAQVQAQQAAAVVPTYSDSEVTAVIQDQLINQGKSPGEVATYVGTQLGVDAARANALVTAEFAVLQTEYVAAQTAKREAAEAAAIQAIQAARDKAAAEAARMLAEAAKRDADAAREALAKAKAEADRAIAELKARTPAVQEPTGTTPAIKSGQPIGPQFGPLLLAVAAAYVLGA